MARTPEKPLLLYDGDCAFCKFWIERWEDITGDRVRYEPAENLKSVKFVLPDGRGFFGAEAVFRSLSYAPGSKGRWLWLYENVPGAKFISESFYSWVAAHRSGLYKVTLFFFGKKK